MTPAWLALAGFGLLVLMLSTVFARHSQIAPWEMSVFRSINRQPEWLYKVLWLPMQLGNLVVGTVIGLLIALIAGDVRVVVGVIAAAGLKLVVERFIRREMHAFLTVRVRPGTSQPGAILRGDVPVAGASFPSGHVILVAAVGGALAPAMPAGVVWIPFAFALIVMVGRVYVGAHNPLDVTAGLGAGLLLGGVLAAFGA